MYSFQRYKANRLVSLIRDVCTAYGEPLDATEAYAKEQVQMWGHDLDAAIACFVSLKAHLHLIDKKTNKMRN